VPADARPLAGSPSSYAGSNSIDDSHNLVARNSWILDAGEASFLCDRIAVAYSASLDADSYRSCRGFRNIAFDEF
jgi:hypothetical protein